jgi:hypothetical protein
MTLAPELFLIRRSNTEDDNRIVSQWCEHQKEKFTESLRPSECSISEEQSGIAIVMTMEEIGIGIVKNSGRNTTLQDRLNYSRLRWWDSEEARSLYNELPAAARPYALLTEGEIRATLTKLRSLESRIPDLVKHLDFVVELLTSPPSTLPPGMSQHNIDKLTAEGDAFGLALGIAGIPVREVSLRWSSPSAQGPARMTNGLSAYLDEDSVIATEAAHFFEREGYTSEAFATRGFTFRSKGRTLAVVDVNRRGGEKILGTDMIIYDRGRHNAVMIQYKMMGGTGNNRGYRPRLDPNLRDEIKRWHEWEREFGKGKSPDARGYRLCESPYYIKLCPKRTEENFSPVELIRGMLFPLELFKLICDDPQLARGPREGKMVGFKNIEKKYFNNSEFKELFTNGWIGNSCNSGDIWRIAIASLENNKDVLAAFTTRPAERE